MKLKKVEQLIVKFITNQANLEEIDILTKWLEKSTDNQTVFQDFVKTNYAIDYVTNTFDSGMVRKNLSQKIKQNNTFFYKRRIQSSFKYAAIVLFCIGTFYFYQKNNVTTQKNNILIPKEELITLVSEDGTVEIINPSDSKNFINKTGKIVGRQDKSKIIYSNELESKNIAYNTIKIPYGKQFLVELSDGTAVHLNSGSSLKYPVKFIEGKNRQVFLTGEAYFEVTKNRKMPFVVSANKMDVTVLGTYFNVAAYQDEEDLIATLIEGKVMVKVNDLKEILAPNQQLSYNITDNKSLLKNVNAKNVVSWKNGYFMFDDLSLLKATKQMSRYYNVDIIIQNKEIENFKLSGSMSRNQNIEDILIALKNLNNISYEIKNNKVYLK